jgi:prepilin-type N-terminal cleavage/methylation domain-containing protein
MSNVKAFTLVELAIVIVIIGLLVGGVLQGAELIAASKRQAVMKWYTQMEASYHIFRSKYDCIPGDCSKARRLWGNVTTNGNDDLKIEQASVREYLYSIEHLTLANLMKGSYMYGSTTVSYNPCVHTPCPANERAGFQFGYIGPDAPSGWLRAYNRRNGNVIVYAGLNNVSLLGATYTPEEAFIFDTKFDDGKPDAGLIFGGNGHRNSVVQSGCSTTHWSESDPQTYQVQNNRPLCILYYFID